MWTVILFLGIDLTTETEKVAMEAAVVVSWFKIFKIRVNGHFVCFLEFILKMENSGYNRDRDDRPRQPRDEAPPRNDPPAEPSSGL